MNLLNFIKKGPANRVELIQSVLFKRLLLSNSSVFY